MAHMGHLHILTPPNFARCCWVPPLPLPFPDASHSGQDRRTCTASTRSSRPAPFPSRLLRGCPSLCQVMLGEGVPRASQRSSKGAPGGSSSSAGWPESSMWGGSTKRRTPGQLWGLRPEHFPTIQMLAAAGVTYGQVGTGAGGGG